jgi:hypothetical protein
MILTKQTTSCIVTTFDGQASMSSTLTVEELPLKQLGEDDNDVSREVSFNLDYNLEYESQPLYPEEIEASWYSWENYMQFKLDKNKLAYEIRNSEPPTYTNVLTLSYKACCSAVCDTDNVLSPQDTLSLIQASEESDTLGMDRWTLKAVSLHRSKRRRLIVSRVLEEQFHDNDWQVLCQESESVSLCSRLFARTLALSTAGETLS